MALLAPTAEKRSAGRAHAFHLPPPPEQLLQLLRRMPRLSLAPAAPEPETEPEPLPLTKSEREKRGRSERAALARLELDRLWLVRNAEERQRAHDFFTTFASDRWRFEELREDGTEVWRLPGARIHTIMGIQRVNASPSLALKLFNDPVAVFTRLFPRIDKMFLSGRVLEIRSKSETVMCACFRLPALIGEGSAFGFPPREFVWQQFVTGLATGNVLVTAATAKEGARYPKVAKGAVRGTLLTSGYYGKAIAGTGRTRVFYLAQCNPAGVLPAWLVNFAATKQAANPGRLAVMLKTGRLEP